MSDQVHLVVGDRVRSAQRLATSLSHHDQSRRKFGQLFHDSPLRGIRFGQYRMQRRHDRDPDVTQKGQNVAASKTSEDAELVL